MKPFGTGIPVNPPTPLGAYKAVVIRGGIGYVSGQFPIRDGRVIQPGRLGDPLDVDAGREAARVAALNVLGQIRNDDPGGLEQVELARVESCIACVPGFADLPRVLDAAGVVAQGTRVARKLAGRFARIEREMVVAGVEMPSIHGPGGFAHG